MLKKPIFYIVGYILVFLSVSMLFSLAWSLYYQDGDHLALIKSIAISLFVGLASMLIFRSNQKYELTSRDGFAIVTLGWITMAFFSSLPFYFSINNNLSLTNSFFEAMSGLTTTGASILGSATYQIEDMSKGLLFWRSFTQFIGGMGIIVFTIAILPMLGMGGVQLFRAEIAGPSADKLTPRVKQTAKLLWGIYVGFVFILALILKIEGMSWFDAFCHSFTTIATAGFSTQNASIGSFGPIVQWTIIVFMFVAATNFSLHYYFIAKGRFEYLKDQEFKYYIILISIFSVLFFINIVGTHEYKINISTLRHSVFTAVSLLTTTGFSTEDFNSWPAFSNMLVFVLLFIGGSAGSTTGGMKIIRTIVIFRYLICEVKRLIHPKGVFKIKVGGRTIDDEVIKSTLGFYLFYIIIFIITALIISSTGLDLVTSLSAAASAIGNIGPALGEVGPAESWGHMPTLVKWLVCFCMLLGRLEIFTVVVLFNSSYWRK